MLSKGSLAFAVLMALAVVLVGVPTNAQGGGGRLSPASLNIDTCGCPSTFGDPACEQRTEWELDKTTDTGDLSDPVAEPYLFNVTVTEGPTATILSGDGQLVITNSGDVTTSLASIAILLEDLHEGPGKGDAPGPSGKNWDVLATATESEFAACGDTAPSAYGLLTQSTGSNLILTDPLSNDLIALSDRVLIEPTVDNDGDGLRDEDAPTPPAGATQVSCSAYDNDGDGAFDEDEVDGIDNDGDGLIDEDSADDDGDGLVDEDGACEDAVVINFSFEFDITGLGLEGPGDGLVPSADDLRIDLITTFDSGGFRGGVTAVDVDCDGDEERDVRSIQQRHRFDPPACTELCQSVTLADTGAAAQDASCVDVSNTFNDANGIIDAIGVAGTESLFSVSGTVTCIGEDCDTNVTNTATLTGAGCDGLIAGSPASASFAVDCGDGGGPGPDPGDFCSQTQGGWGSGAAGNNTGTLRDTYFNSVFPSGVCVGDGDCIDADAVWALLLQSSQAVEDYLPAGSTASTLTADQTDPEVTSAGVFGGQLVAATLNVGFDEAGIGKCTLSGTCDFAHAPGTLGTLIYGSCVATPLQGLSVNDVIALANTAISGGGLPPGVSISDLNDALSALNEEFVDCDTVATGCLTLP